MISFDPIILGNPTPPRTEVRNLLLAALAILLALIVAISPLFFYHVNPIIIFLSLLFPAMWPFIMCTNALSLSRSIHAVTVSPEGITLHRLLGTRFIPWTALASVTIARRKFTTNSTPHELQFRGRRNHRIDALPITFPALDDLLMLIEFFSLHILGRNIRDNFTELKQELDHKIRHNLLGIASAAFMSLMFGFFFTWGLHEYLHDKHFSDHAVSTAALILNRTHDDYDHTQSIEYSFFDPNHHEHSRTAEMTKPAWTALANQSTVQIAYLPGDPNQNHLLTGELSYDSLAMTIASGCVSLLTFFFFIFLLLGYDLRTINGRFTFTRNDQPLARKTGALIPPIQRPVKTRP